MYKFCLKAPITNVVIFGCGGTGGRAIPLITQLLTMSQYTRDIAITLVDGDIIEPKNLKRQLFLEQEVGKNKAIAMADRYRKGFKANVEPVPYFVPSIEQQQDFLDDRTIEPETAYFFDSFFTSFTTAVKGNTNISSTKIGDQPPRLNNNGIANVLNPRVLNREGNVVFISCVDSPDARRYIIQLVNTILTVGTSRQGYGFLPRRASNFTIIDAGNEDSFGQVTYFNPIVQTLCPDEELVALMPDRSPFSLELAIVPMPIAKYRYMKAGAAQGDCAGMDQSLAINNMMAALIAQIFQNLLYSVKMDFHTIRANLNGTFSTDKLSLKWMKGVLTNDQDYLAGVRDTESEEFFKGYRYSLKNLFVGKWDNAYTNEYAQSRNTYRSDNYVDYNIASKKGDLVTFFETSYYTNHWAEVVWPTLYVNYANGLIKLSSLQIKVLEHYSTMALYEPTNQRLLLGSNVIADPEITSEKVMWTISQEKVMWTISQGEDYGYNNTTYYYKISDTDELKALFPKIGYKGLAFPVNDGNVLAGAVYSLHFSSLTVVAPDPFYNPAILLKSSQVAVTYLTLEIFKEMGKAKFLEEFNRIYQTTGRRTIFKNTIDVSKDIYSKVYNTHRNHYFHIGNFADPVYDEEKFLKIEGPKAALFSRGGFIAKTREEAIALFTKRGMDVLPRGVTYDYPMAVEMAKIKKQTKKEKEEKTIAEKMQAIENVAAQFVNTNMRVTEETIGVVRRAIEQEIAAVDLGFMPQVNVTQDGTNPNMLNITVQEVVPVERVRIAVGINENDEGL